MIERLERLERMEREIEELKKEIKAEEKRWPDTFEEAKEQSMFWGIEVCGIRYFVCMRGDFYGSAVSARSTWTNKEGMGKFWSEAGFWADYKYSFRKFDSAKELYLWMAEGE